MSLNSSVPTAILALSLNLGLPGGLLADQLDGAIGATGQQTLSTERPSPVAADQAAQCFTRVKSNGTVWLPTQRLFDELMRIRASLKESLADEPTTQRIQILSKTIFAHCELIENQHALERARYLLATLETGTLDKASVDAVRDMLVAADGQGALRLVKHLGKL